MSKGKCRSLQGEKQNISEMELFRVILNSGDQNNFTSGISPSVYMQQMLLTTEERTATLIKQQRSNELNAGDSSGCFRVTPQVVIFQQFSPGNTYNVTLSVTNITSFSQHLKLICTKNSWFTLECEEAADKRKLAPGMSILCDVNFCPDEKRDYKHQAVFATGTKSFAVPIVAIGPRPLLNFPDYVEIPRKPVKILSVRELLIRNIGEVPAVFSLSTISPFAIHPQKGVLAAGDTMQVTVNFLSDRSGCFKGNLIVTYETGGIISLKLCGSAELGIIRLDKGSIQMEETFLGLTRSKTFSIHNKSDWVSTFKWVLYENCKRDKVEEEKYKKYFEIMKNIEVLRRVDLEHYNICNPLLHELTCQRIFAEELSSLKYQSFPFIHPNYKLVPLEGEIRPRSSVDITLTFEPDETGVIDSKAYLEVTGCEQRIPLRLHGTCIGPLMKLNLTRADLGAIFLCSSHNYEVICGNKGDIPGTLVYHPRTANFGGKINVSPVQIKLQPGNYKSVNLCFSSNRIGEFTERVDFVVKESLEVIPLFISGSVICPTLHFDRPNLDFAITALGFTTKHEVCLHNSSPVPVTFVLTITQDGTHPAMTHEDFFRCVTKPSLVSNPKEFGIAPSEGVVAPHSFQRVKISYTPNVVRTSQAALKVDMWDSDSEPVMLPIIFSSKVASLVVKPSEIVIRFCFINFPYVRSITIENKSDVEGFFFLPPQSVTIIPSVMYSFSSNQGYLKPNESKSISLKIVTTALGAKKVQLSLLAIGERSLTPCCSLICNGHGPIVTVQPTQLNWGKVQLLEQLKSTITLVNASPIPAQFVANLHNRVSACVVSPTSGSLEPNKSLELEITIYLRDTGKYSDRVNIEIINGNVIACALIAVGIGTSICLSPNVVPVFDMGVFFRDQDISIPIIMVNKGTRHHRVTWSTNADYSVHPTSGKTEHQLQNKFAIDPCTIDLPPGVESAVHCKIRWKLNEFFTEQWFLHGQIKGQKEREVLGASVFKATLTDPNISFSKRKLMFLYDPSASEPKAGLTDSLSMTNQSQLDLKVTGNIDPPFELVAENGDDGFENIKTIALRDDVRTRICIRFNTQAIDMSNLYSRTFRSTLTFDYETHRAKVQDKIQCFAEVIYPNISFSSTELIILNCEVGLTACNRLTLVNAGHLPVNYSFEWRVVNAVGKPTSARDMPCLRGEPKSRIEEFSVIAEKHGGGQRDSNAEGDNTRKERSNSCLFKQKLPTIFSTIRKKSALAVSTPATSNGDLLSISDFSNTWCRSLDRT